MKWIILNAGGSIGFDTAADAETFLLSQSKNPEWLKQFEIKFNTGPDKKLQAFITTNERVTLHL